MNIRAEGEATFKKSKSLFVSVPKGNILLQQERVPEKV